MNEDFGRHGDDRLISTEYLDRIFDDRIEIRGVDHDDSSIHIRVFFYDTNQWMVAIKNEMSRNWIHLKPVSTEGELRQVLEMVATWVDYKRC